MQVILSISTDEMTLGAVGLVWTLLLVIPIAVLFWQVSWGFKNRKQVTSN
ncbi:hypothetical protein AFLA70_6g007521 [Aspergillus flavus AF70]|nr:hypothetical protein AFLA70_6g007521 [Aspergillus flavus AF70]